MLAMARTVVITFFKSNDEKSRSTLCKSSKVNL